MRNAVRAPVAAFALFLTSAAPLFAASINLPGTLWDSVAQLVVVKNTGLTTPEGPACDSGGDLYFSDHRNFSHTNAVIWRVPGGTGAAELYKQNLDVACGIVFDSRNRMIYGGWHGLWRIDNLGDAATVTVLAQGDSLNEVNDMSLAADGGIFFTGNLWDSESYVYYRSPAGALKKALTLPGAPSAAFPNGIEYVEEKQRVYLCLSQMNVVRTYQVDGQKNLVSPAQFASVSGPDGLALDEMGNVWVASSSGNRIAVFDSAGRSVGAIMLDWGATNCAFGGPGRRTLYITAGTSVLRINLRVAGRPTTGSLRTAPASPAPARRTQLRGSREGRRTFGVSGQALDERTTASGLRLDRASDRRAVVVQ